MLWAGRGRGPRRPLRGGAGLRRGRAPPQRRGRRGPRDPDVADPGRALGVLALAQALPAVVLVESVLQDENVSISLEDFSTITHVYKPLGGLRLAQSCSP